MLLDVSKIDGYAEMSAEDKVRALEAFEYEDNAAELEKLRNTVSKSNAEAKSWKDKYNATLSDVDKQKQAQTEAAEAEKKEKEELLSRIAELEKNNTLREYTMSFSTLGFEEKLAAETANAMAEGKSATVFANLKKFLEAYKKSVEAELMNKTPHPGGAGGAEDAPAKNPALDFVKKRAAERAAIAKQAEEARNSFLKG